ncbi:MAG: hypothetical protein ACKO96_11740 [Flammeovirgaceae bacterium]
MYNNPPTTDQIQTPAPTLQELIGRTVTIQNKQYNFDTKRLKWGKFCDLKAELQSGMVAKYYQESGESEMVFTKEFALKESFVKNELTSLSFSPLLASTAT